MPLMSVPLQHLPPMIGASGSTSQNLNATGSRVATFVCAPRSGIIRYVHWRTNTVTTWTTTELSFQDTSTTAFEPDGTADQSVSILSSPGANAWVTTDFGAGTGRSVSTGDSFWVVWTTSGSPSWRIEQASPTSHDLYGEIAYESHLAAALHNGTSWAGIAGALVAVLEYEDGTIFYAPYLSPGITNSVTYNSGSSPNERGNRFVCDYSQRIVGARVMMPSAPVGNFDLVLYEGTTARATASIDKDVIVNRTNQIHTKLFPAPFTTTAGVEYIIAAVPTSASNITIGQCTANNAAWLDALSLGQSCYGVNRSGGAWSAEPTRRYTVSALADQIDIPSGGGSSVYLVEG